MEGDGTLCGVTSHKQAKCAENCCAVVAPKAVAQIASARKPHRPARPCANGAALVSV